MDSLTSFTTSPSFTSQSAMANPDYVTFGSFRPASCWSWHSKICAFKTYPLFPIAFTKLIIRIFI